MYTDVLILLVYFENSVKVDFNLLYGENQLGYKIEWSLQ